MSSFTFLKRVNQLKDLSVNNIDYDLRDDGTVYVVPTKINDNGRVVKVGRPFKYNGPLHRRLAEKLPRLFFIEREDKPVKKSRPRAVAPQVSDDDMRAMHFENRKEMRQYIKAHNIRDVGALIDMREAELENDVTRNLTEDQWRELGFANGSEGRRFATMLRNDPQREEELLTINGFEKAWKKYRETLMIEFLPPVLTYKKYGGAVETWRIDHKGHAVDYHVYLEKLQEQATSIVHRYQGENRKPCSVVINVRGITFTHVSDDSKGVAAAAIKAYDNLDFDHSFELVISTDEFHNINKKAIFKSGNKIVIYGDEAEKVVSEGLSNIAREIDFMHNHPSGWQWMFGLHTYVNIHDKDPLVGKSWFKLPQWIEEKRAVWNPKNKCDECFLICCVLAKHKEELDKKDYLNMSYRLRDIVESYKSHTLFSEKHFPMKRSRKDWDIYEEVFGFNIWVWMADNSRKTFIPMEFSKRKYKEDVLLVLVRDPTSENTHYVYVPEPSRLMNAHADTKSHSKILPCLGCAHYSTTANAFDRHQKLCILGQPVNMVMPANCGKQKKKESAVAYEIRRLKSGPRRERFSALHSTLDIPAVMYYDQEATSMLKVARVEKEESGARKGKATEILDSQPINSAKLVVETILEGTIFDQNFDGECPLKFCDSCTHVACDRHRNPVRQLLDAIDYWGKHIYDNYFKVKKPIQWTDEARLAFEKAVNCVICDTQLNDEHYDAHHCRFTGKVYGAAHKTCNKKAQAKFEIAVVAHNFKGYDSHPVLKELKPSDFKRMIVIPDNTQNFKQVTLEKHSPDVLPYDKKLISFKIGDRNKFEVLIPVECEYDDDDDDDDEDEDADEEDDGAEIDEKLTKPIPDKEYHSVFDKSLFYKVVKNINLCRQNMSRKYRLVFKDSCLFLQSSLEKAAASMRDEDFHAISNYVDRLLFDKNLTNERLRSFINQHALLNEGEAQDNREQRAIFTKQIFEIYGWGSKLVKKAQKAHLPVTKEALMERALKIQKKKYAEFLENPDAREFTFRLCRYKGVYPYEWFDDKSKWTATELPPLEAFFSRLSFQKSYVNDLTQKELGGLKQSYSFAQLVWNWFEFKTFKEYHMLYLDMDVYLLQDVMNRFRANWRDSFAIDPLHFSTLPGAAKESLLRKTHASFNLFGPDQLDMYLQQMHSIRGGVSTLGTLRYAKANNKYLSGKIDPKELIKYLFYIDVNSLYAFIMQMFKLPYGGYKWIAEHLLGIFKRDILKLDADGDKGYQYTVDVHLPPCKSPGKHGKDCTCLHDEQADYPCLPENTQVPWEWLSSAQKKHKGVKEGKTPPVLGDRKLIPSLLPKKNYSVHIKTLQLAVSLGWVIDKVHSVLEFDQKAWMEPYITFNAKKRAEAKRNNDAFGSENSKLASNIVFGKMCEDVMKHMRVEIIKTEGEERRHKKLRNDLRFLRGSGEVPINDDLSSIYMGKSSAYLNKPIIVGTVILDLAKYWMQTIWYGVLKKNYGAAIKMIYTDTDSFIFQTEGIEDFYAEMKKYPQIFDFSNFPEDHPLYSPHSEVGMLKLEHVRPISEVVAIRSKMYSILLDNNEQSCTAKGTKKAAQKTLLHDMYKSVVFEGCSFRRNNFSLRTRDHVNGLECLNKIALSPFNDKNFMKEDGSLLPWGHAGIKMW